MVLKEATDSFGDISVKPTYYDMFCMNITLLPILLKFPYDQDNTTHNLSGLISPYTKYIAKYGTAFQRPTLPKPYIPTITITMYDAEQRKSKAIHSARKEDYILYKAAEMGVMRFLNTNVDGTWYQELENAEIFYTKVTAFEMMVHLRNCSGGWNAIDAVDIMSDM